MNLQGIKWPLVALMTIVTFGFLLGGFQLFKEQSIDRPLVKLFAEVAAVQDVKMEEGHEATTIRVKLGPVDDLRKTYQDLQRRAGQIDGLGPHRIQVEDVRTPELQQAFDRLHFAIQEANATGAFTKMARDIDEMAPSLGLDKHRIFVDEQRIYVALYRGGAYLYEVVPRVPARNTAPNTAERR